MLWNHLSSHSSYQWVFKTVFKTKGSPSLFITWIALLNIQYCAFLPAMNNIWISIRKKNPDTGSERCIFINVYWRLIWNALSGRMTAKMPFLWKGNRENPCTWISLIAIWKMEHITSETTSPAWEHSAAAFILYRCDSNVFFLTGQLIYKQVSYLPSNGSFTVEAIIQRL